MYKLTHFSDCLTLELCRMQRFHFYQDPLLSEPPIIQLPVDLGEVFVLYPQTGSPWPIQHSSVFRAVVGFRTIMNEIGNRTFGFEKARGPLSLDEAMGYRARILEWMQSLPSSLSPRQIVLPAPLKLQYAHTLNTCFEANPFLQHAHLQSHDEFV